MKNPKVVTIKIAGPAGLGIKSSGLLLSKILVAHGYYICDYNEYPSLVRGGHNTYQVSFSLQEIHAPYCKVDILFSLKPGHWQEHQEELKSDALVFSEEKVKGILPLPLSEIALKAGSPLTANIICLGVITFLFSLDQKICKKIITTTYKKGSEENLKAFDLGYKYISQTFKGGGRRGTPKQRGPLWVFLGENA